MFWRNKQALFVPTLAPSVESLKEMSLDALAMELSHAQSMAHTEDIFYQQALEQWRINRSYGSPYPAPSRSSDYKIYQDTIDRIKAEFSRRRWEDLESARDAKARTAQEIGDKIIGNRMARSMLGFHRARRSPCTQHPRTRRGVKLSI